MLRKAAEVSGWSLESGQHLINGTEHCASYCTSSYHQVHEVPAKYNKARMCLNHLDAHCHCCVSGRRSRHHLELDTRNEKSQADRRDDYGVVSSA